MEKFACLVEVFKMVTYGNQTGLRLAYSTRREFLNAQRGVRRWNIDHTSLMCASGEHGEQ